MLLYSLEWVHSEGDVHARAVGQERSQGRLLKEPEDQDAVPVEDQPDIRISDIQ